MLAKNLKIGIRHQFLVSKCLKALLRKNLEISLRKIFNQVMHHLQLKLNLKKEIMLHPQMREELYKTLCILKLLRYQ